MAKKHTNKDEAAASQPVLKTKDIAPELGMSTKALRKLLRGTEIFDDKHYTNYRFTSVGEVKHLLGLDKPAAQAAN